MGFEDYKGTAPVESGGEIKPEENEESAMLKELKRLSDRLIELSEKEKLSDEELTELKAVDKMINDIINKQKKGSMEEEGWGEEEDLEVDDQ